MENLFIRYLNTKIKENPTGVFDLLSAKKLVYRNKFNKCPTKKISTWVLLGRVNIL